uniref:Uncharacterized protein n=1 Tax=Neobodo designis TaxID=312471 RepID=A0A7S1MA66_NEODS|mmetsp:Transcript_36703/g.113142  ORF Transcript_36703/g.113142 Transcript_36703/m.113142 type:complete len:121 (+) Transcript_36703:50-412(+)|eukprot:CAMPEP_0174853966 /NCGR_PEP_ID=MMETSP1114-20130205/29663_1 /TAXON_ID=312471 /ORGANISM="Neobodo designis, Strain CCAP 1951/1" /LENGTH=120 /DNA_ID=CAMNT_0016088633 /DNA_START=50 /DNA_END=412 /DNA_ORIENTATION=+
MPHSHEVEGLDHPFDTICNIFRGEAHERIMIKEYWALPHYVIEETQLDDLVRRIREMVSQKYFRDERRRDAALKLLEQLDERTERADLSDDAHDEWRRTLLALHATLRAETNPSEAQWTE